MGMKHRESDEKHELRCVIVGEEILWASQVSQ